MRNGWTPRVTVVVGVIFSLVSTALSAPEPPVKLGIVVLPDPAGQIEYSTAYGLLFVRNSDNDIRIIDTTTNTQIGFRKGNDRFMDFDLTPDERYLYAAGYNGAQTGGANHVHRFDLVTRTWETGVIPNTIYRIEAMDAGRFLLQEQNQHVDMILNRFGATTVQLDRIRADYYGDFEYDHTTGRVIHGSSGSTSREIHARRIVGDTLVYEEDSGGYGSAQSGGGTYVLSTDFKYFYYGRLQVDAQNVRRNRNFFYEPIYAATSEIAFGSSRYYDVETGGELGSLGFDSTVYGLSGDGSELWAFRSDGNVLFHYQVPEPATLSFLALGGLAVLRRRRRK